MDEQTRKNDEETENEVLEEEEAAEEITDAGPLSGMQTLPRLPDEETDSEKLTRIEEVLDKLCAKLGDEEDLQASYETMVQFFKSLKDSTEKLSRKLENEYEYTRNLKDRISRNETEHENLVLKKRLDEDLGKLIVIYESMQKASCESEEKLRTEMQYLEKNFRDKLDELDAKNDRICDVEAKLEEKINDFRDQMIKASDNEYTKLAADCKKVLTACNQRMSEIKADVLTFLNSCEKQTKDLISRVPEQKRKFSWKDIVIYALSGTCIVCMVIQSLAK